MGTSLGNYKDINQYRRRKKIKQISLKLGMAAVVLALLFVLLNVLNVFQGNELEKVIARKDGTAKDQFPLTIKNEQLTDIQPVGNSIAILTKSSLLTYSTEGDKVQSAIHGYTNPVTKEGIRRLLTYDRGGYKFRVDSSAGTVGEVTVDNTIICADISSTGNVAVVMSYKNFSPVVAVYDTNLKVIYTYSATKDFTSVSFSPDGEKLALCSIEIFDGILGASVYELDIGKKTDARITNVQDILPLGIRYQDGGHIAVIGKNSLVSVKNSKQTRLDYKGDLLRFAAVGSGTVLVNQNLEDSSCVLSVVSPEGKSTAAASVDDEVLDLYTAGGNILFLGKKALCHYDMNLNPKSSSAAMDKSCSKVIYTGSAAFLLCGDQIEKKELT